MPHKFGRTVITSIVFFSLFFFVGSFFLLYFRLENWACVIGPLATSYAVMHSLKLSREDLFSAKLLQAAAAVSGLPILLAIFLLTGDREGAVSSVPLSLGGGPKPTNDYFAGLITFLVAANLFGLLPSFLLNMIQSMFTLPKFRRAARA
jgi:hypothetical protein